MLVFFFKWGFLYKNQSLALQTAAAQRLRPRQGAAFGHAEAGAALRHRGVLNLSGAVSTGRKQLRLPGTAPQRHAVAREPSRSANGAFPPRPPSWWVEASCSCSVALAADPACGTARHGTAQPGTETITWVATKAKPCGGTGEAAERDTRHSKVGMYTNISAANK